MVGRCKGRTDLREELRWLGLALEGWKEVFLGRVQYVWVSRAGKWWMLLEA